MARAAQSELNQAPQALYVAFELSQKDWKLACSDGERTFVTSVPARALDRALAQIRHAAKRLGTTGRVVTCYEAGRDGFWLHRALTDRGIENSVLDAASIEVDRRARRAKTDRLDARKLVALLVRADRGDKSVRIVNVPSPEVEGARRIERELQKLKNERTAHINRIRGLLMLIGRSLKRLSDARAFLDAGWTGADGRPIEPSLRSEILREFVRLDLLNQQILEVERSEKALVKSDSQCALVAKKLARISGIGETTANMVSHESLGWRDFENRRQVASAAGLTPTPYSSGNDEREQGISKAGNARVRWIMVQLAWTWIRRQPDSPLTAWYRERFGRGSRRTRRIGIVALARRLLVDLWRYVKFDQLPEGVTLKPLI